MKKEFNIKTSSLNNLTEKQIESTINKHSKRELLEILLTWKSLAKQHESTIDELNSDLSKLQKEVNELENSIEMHESEFGMTI